MATLDDPRPGAGYRHTEDACLDRTAAALDFGRVTPAEAAAAAERRVDPFRQILAGLLRSVGRPTGR